MDYCEDDNDITAWASIVGQLRGAGCVFAEDEAQLLMSCSRSRLELVTMVEKRTAGFPLEHIVGWVEFCGLRIKLDAKVFVPRQRSEFLVRQAMPLVQKGDIVVDLCCGSGALGAAIVASIEHLELHAVDIDPVAVLCARRNLHADKSFVYEGDLFDPLPEQLHNRVNVIIANAPYVPTEAIKFMPTEARVHEARIALDGGEDGLDFHRRIVEKASLWLKSGGVLLVETSERQAPLTAKLFAQHGFIPEWVRSEERDANVIIGRIS